MDSHRVPTAVRLMSKLGAWLWVAFTLLPVAFVAVTSIKPGGVALSVPPSWSFMPTVSNFSAVLERSTFSSVWFPSLLLHSTVVAIASTGIVLAVGLPAAYALTLQRFRARKGLAMWILSTLMFPPIVSVIPVFIFASRIHAMDTYPVLIVPYAAFNLPIAIWVLRSSIRQLPETIVEAARVDGCSVVGAVRRIVLPLVVPGMVTAAMISIMLSWNEFLFALTLTRQRVVTAPVGVEQFTGMYGTQWGLLAAASVIIVAPMLVLTLVLRRRLVAGLSFGAVK